ncbi:helix-turn-helix domain-containing protein [Actinoplanes palleronii]|nr:helix-turn-helix domain-containing protein [Actinoplanes palleronii]
MPPGVGHRFLYEPQHRRHDRPGHRLAQLHGQPDRRAGVSGKELIDRRIVLEAQRLLAHSDHTAAQIAARLGFASATNFSKYFHTRTGVTPIAFRGSSRTT